MLTFKHATSSCNLKFPYYKMYWGASPNTYVQARSDSMPRNTFERIIQNLRLCDNEQLDKYNKFSKPLAEFNKSNRRF